MKFRPSIDWLGDRVLPGSMMVGAVIGSDPLATDYAPIGCLVGGNPYQVSVEGPDPGIDPSINDSKDPIPAPYDIQHSGAVGPG